MKASEPVDETPKSTAAAGGGRGPDSPAAGSGASVAGAASSTAGATASAGGAASSATPTANDSDGPRLRAAASGTLEVFVNGELLSATQQDTQLLDLRANLRSAEVNAIVVRAHQPAAGSAYVHLELAGAFGRAGTSDRWKAKAATASEAQEPAGPWANVDYDDSGWVPAAELSSSAAP